MNMAQHLRNSSEAKWETSFLSNLIHFQYILQKQYTTVCSQFWHSDMTVGPSYNLTHNLDPKQHGLTVEIIPLKTACKQKHKRNSCLMNETFGKLKYNVGLKCLPETFSLPQSWLYWINGLQTLRRSLQISEAIFTNPVTRQSLHYNTTIITQFSHHFSENLQHWKICYEYKTKNDN